MMVLSTLGACDAQPEERWAGATVQVQGEATVTATPDQAQVDVGVVTRAREAREAVAANAREIQQVISAAREAAGADARIETAAFFLSPEYRFPENEEPRIIGYIASNTVRVTLNDLTRVGTVIDAATSAGANEVQRIRFLLRDDAAIRARALREAALEARTKAANLTQTLGLEQVAIISVVETATPPPPFFDIAFARAAAQTPILPGRLETRATVMLEVAVRDTASTR